MKKELSDVTLYESPEVEHIPDLLRQLAAIYRHRTDYLRYLGQDDDDKMVMVWNLYSDQLEQCAEQCDKIRNEAGV